MEVKSFSKDDAVHFGWAAMKTNIAVSGIQIAFVIMIIAVAGSLPLNDAYADQLWAGAAKAEITDTEAGPVNDPLFVKALVITNNYKMIIGGRIMTDIAKIMITMGEKEFTAVWREVADKQEPPLKALREIVEKMEEEQG